MAGKTAVSCETCTYYTFDEDYEEYVCDMDMDEDEYIRLISDSHYECPYYRNGGRLPDRQEADVNFLSLFHRNCLKSVLK